jgi:hypothetical protein
MLNITVPSNTSSGLNFSTFESYGLPSPPNGVDEEINDDLVLKFEDEQEATIYAAQLENLSNQLDNKTTQQYVAINDIIMTIRNDEFVQSYTG